MSRADHVIENRASQNYIAEYGAPKLELENVHQFKNDTQNNLNNKIKARLTIIPSFLIENHAFSAKKHAFLCHSNN